jgi:hypothetical protein
MQTTSIISTEPEITTVLFFYSKRNIKSMKLYKLIQQINVDIQTINVDTTQVRDLLLADNKYKIKIVPTVLTIYDNGEFMIYTGNELDQWFQQLVENVNSLASPQQPQQQEYSTLGTVGDVSLPSRGLQGPLGIINSSGLQNPLGTINAPPTNQDLSSIPETSMVKEVKKSTISAAEMAAAMMKEKEQYDEVLDNNKPFV